jgi:hypothetical protein
MLEGPLTTGFSIFSPPSSHKIRFYSCSYREFKPLSTWETFRKCILRASKNLLGFFSVARGHLIKCKKLTSRSKNACEGKHFISQKSPSLIIFNSPFSTLRWVKRLSHTLLWEEEAVIIELTSDKVH